MKFEKPDVYANVNLSRVHLEIIKDDDIQRQHGEYCWVLGGTVQGGDIQIKEPQQVRALRSSPIFAQGYFEVPGPSRMISIKEYVQLYDAERKRRRMPLKRWHSSVYEAIREVEEFEKNG